MKLTEAFICLDCDEIFNIKETKVCPACGNKYSIFLSKYIKPINSENDVEREKHEQMPLSF
jgi:rRNA maturation endonuclease Nob1